MSDAETHLGHLRELAKRLVACKDALEAKWKRQVLWLALGIAILLGWDAQVMKVGLLDASTLEVRPVRIATRVIVALMLLHHFFQFGLLLGQYREAKYRASLARTAFERAIRDRRAKEYVAGLNATHSQFEFFFRKPATLPAMDVPKVSVLAYLAIVTGAMHGLGAFLLYDLGRNLWPADAGGGPSAGGSVLVLPYAVAIAGLYRGHLRGIERQWSDGGAEHPEDVATVAHQKGTATHAAFWTGVFSVVAFGVIVGAANPPPWPLADETEQVE